jgi:AAA domain/DnaB-like helicase N terminal domain
MSSVQTEETVIGSMLLGSNERVDLTSEDFSRPDHQIIWAAIEELRCNGSPLDVVLVSDHLERSGNLEKAGGFAHLSRLARETTTAANVTSYAARVREDSCLRELKTIGAETENGAEAAEILERVRAKLDRVERSLPRGVEPLATAPVATWSSSPTPAPRDWVIEGLVPARRVTSFLADGGLGKTTIGVQIGVHVAMNRALYGVAVSGGPVLGVFCEDEQDELHRRIAAACAAENIEMEQLDSLVVLSRDGCNNVLCTFERDQIVFTQFYRQLEATVAALRPRLVILDTLADFFAGDYLSTPHARQFIRTALGGLSARHGCAVLLIAHPSMAGMTSGDGSGFSTAWNNAVRSRLYLRRPKTDDLEAARDRRVLEVRKSNYAPSGVTVPLLWQAGAFAPDPQPIEEGSRAPKTDSPLAGAIRAYFNQHAPDRTVVMFGALLKGLQSSGALPKDGKPDTLRKTLNRSLKELVKAAQITETQVPRGGYRVA